MSGDGITRREFIKRGAIGVVGAGAMLHTAAAQEAAPEPEERNKRDTMRYRVLGRTKLLVSELSMGGQFLTAGVMAAALDKGVNLVHASVEYPGCFEELATVLKDRRDEVFLGLKGRPGLGSFREVDGWLRTLNTDHADFVFLPTISPDEARDADGRVRQQFEALKAAGKAGFLGITCHNEVVPVAQAAVEAGHWDAIMSRYGAPFRAGLEPVITQAKEKDVGFIGMKSLQAGGGRRNWTTAFQTALDHPGVTTVLKGLPDYDILSQLSGAVLTRPTEEARRQYEREAQARLASVCAGCGACSGCPQGVAIEDTLRCAFYYGEELGRYDYGRHVYATIPEARTVLACGDCGRCEAVCRQRLPVRRMLREAHRRLA